MSAAYSHMSWVRGYYHRGLGRVPNTYIAKYRLTDLIHKGYIDHEEGQGLLDEAGLKDFGWDVTWPEDFETPDEYLEDRIGNVQGYAIFVHGWTGNRTIWEDLPAMTVLSNRRLVAMTVDHNGVGQSVFTTTTP